MKRLDAIKEENLGDNRFRVLLPGSFAGVSLLLSALGIHGVISSSVTQRTRELGSRTAPGASRGDVLRLVLRHGLGLSILGLLLGGGGAFAVNHLLGSLLFGVGGRDPLTLFLVALLLAAIALLACLIPARRAAKMDPLVALRNE